MLNLRSLREERKLSQQKLADLFELAQSQIQSYETGAYEPDISTMQKYADYFDTSIDFLLGRTTNRRKPDQVREYELSKDEQTLVDRYRKLMPNQRRSLDLFLSSLEDQ